MKSKKRIVAIILVILCCFALTACNKDGEQGEKKDLIFITEYSSITDDSFLSLSYSAFSARASLANVSSKTTAVGQDVSTVINSAIAEAPDLVWGADFSFGDAFMQLAPSNPDILFAVTDYVIAETVPSNMLAIEFKTEEAAFLAGYAVAKTEGIDTIGFIGGDDVSIIQKMGTGFFNGARYAASEDGFAKTLTILDPKYVGSFDDKETAKTLALAMYNDGADVIFHAAGSGGFGVMDAAVEKDKQVVGIDYDQSEYAPDNVLTCVLKKIEKAIGGILDDLIDGKAVGGKNYVFNTANEGVGISSGNLSLEVYASLAPLIVKIANGTLDVTESVG